MTIVVINTAFKKPMNSFISSIFAINEVYYKMDIVSMINTSLNFEY